MGPVAWGRKERLAGPTRHGGETIEVPAGWRASRVDMRQRSASARLGPDPDGEAREGPATPGFSRVGGAPLSLAPLSERALSERRARERYERGRGGHRSTPGTPFVALPHPSCSSLSPLSQLSLTPLVALSLTPLTALSPLSQLSLRSHSSLTPLTALSHRSHSSLSRPLTALSRALSQLSLSPSHGAEVPAGSPGSDHTPAGGWSPGPAGGSSGQRLSRGAYHHVLSHRQSESGFPGPRPVPAAGGSRGTPDPPARLRRYGGSLGYG